MRRNQIGAMSEQAERRGLWKLMLKLPALRGQLQLLTAHSNSLGGLCEAYDDASTTLDRLRSKPSLKNSAMIAEYETICSEIETEVIEICLDNGSSAG
jgi:hypothetical protein